MNKIIELRQMKDIELEILKKVVEFCDDNNLRYFLAGGTLLGAIRHKGFIPWDDDIDIIMPRKDYMKFLQLSNNGIGNKLKVIDAYNSTDYYYPFAKVFDSDTKLIEHDISTKEIGVYIDIFPMDGLPTNIELSRKHINKIYYFNILRFLMIHKLKKHSRKPHLLLMSTLLNYLFRFKWIIKKMDELATKYDFDSCEYVAVVVSGYGQKERIEKKDFSNFVKVEFEKEYFNAPVGYERYLTNLYGNYMVLPPVDKRISHHKYEVYWR
ncbi:MAG: LicD family protein [Bacillota bacterium]